MTKQSSIYLVFVFSYIAAGSVFAQNNDELITQGKELYIQQVSSWICHGNNAEGRIGPTIFNGPISAQIKTQFDSKPQMAFFIAAASVRVLAAKRTV